MSIEIDWSRPDIFLFFSESKQKIKRSPDFQTSRKLDNNSSPAF